MGVEVVVRRPNRPSSTLLLVYDYSSAGRRGQLHRCLAAVAAEAVAQRPAAARRRRQPPALLGTLAADDSDKIVWAEIYKHANGLAVLDLYVSERQESIGLPLWILSLADKNIKLLTRGKSPAQS